ncbi:hypothetical protein D3C72_1941980 [compost metagenome]
MVCQNSSSSSARSFTERLNTKSVKSVLKISFTNGLSSEGLMERARMIRSTCGFAGCDCRSMKISAALWPAPTMAMRSAPGWRAMASR